MRNKEWKVVVTFESTNHAIALENVFKEQGVPGRLIPVPRQITAGCGLAWCSPLHAQSFIRNEINRHQLHYEEIVELEL